MAAFCFSANVLFSFEPPYFNISRKLSYIHVNQKGEIATLVTKRSSSFDFEISKLAIDINVFLRRIVSNFSDESIDLLPKHDVLI